jgi:mono/diheme cytochrome c family protein
MARQFVMLRRYLPLICLLALAGSAGAETGEELFEAKCVGCHTIGGVTGPAPT